MSLDCSARAMADSSELSTLPGSSPDLKRPFPNSSSPSTSSSKRLKVEPPVESATDIPDLPDAALLYHYAYSAWQAAHRHLAQTFIPTTTTPASSSVDPIWITDPENPDHTIKYRPDTDAAYKPLSLHILAIDMLKIGLGMSDLPDKERVAFGILFGKVGLEVLSGQKALRDRKGKQKASLGMLHDVDEKRLIQDVEEQINRSMAIARKSSYLVLLLHKLELLSVRLLLYQGKSSVAKRLVKQASEAAHAYPAHMYALSLLLLERESTLGQGALGTLDDVLKYARHNRHDRVCQVLLLARTRLLFHSRRWDLISAALDELGATMDWTEEKGLPGILNTAKDPSWLATIAVHFMLYKCLWEGRQGRAERVKQLRKQTFGLMDEISECRAFSPLRQNGGLLEIPITHNGSTSYLLVQSTPPNVLYALTYHIALVSARDISGKRAKAKALVYSEAMLHTVDTARGDDIWDLAFSPHHSLAYALDLQRQVILIRAGVMLEKAFALIYRSSFPAGDKMLDETIKLLRDKDLFNDLASHILLLRAQCAHLIGQGSAAVRYYQAGLSNLVPGSELQIAFQIGLLGCNGQLDGPNINSEVYAQVKAIVEQAKHSTSSALVGVSHFLASLLESGAMAKTKLRAAFQETHTNADKLLYVLLFAFLASVDVSGDSKLVAEQLERGRALAKGMGGLDGPEGVGNGALGVWFAHKLSKLYKHVGHDLHGSLVDCVRKHRSKIKESEEYGFQRYGSER